MRPVTTEDLRSGAPPPSLQARRAAFLHALDHRVRSEYDRLIERLDVLDQLGALGSYRLLLQGVYGLYVPLERKLAAAIRALRLDLDFGARRKTPWLMRDLLALGCSRRELERLPLCADLPAIDDGAKVFGCLYVMEAATVGGRRLARLVEDSLSINATCGAAFFASYGERIQPLWESFCGALVAFARDDETQEAVIASALETFAKYERWMLCCAGRTLS
jgi:heme oxygenase